jgi:hypothetical protein
LQKHLRACSGAIHGKVERLQLIELCDKLVNLTGDSPCKLRWCLGTTRCGVQEAIEINISVIDVPPQTLWRASRKRAVKSALQPLLIFLNPHFNRRTKPAKFGFFKLPRIPDTPVRPHCCTPWQVLHQASTRRIHFDASKKIVFLTFLASFSGRADAVW